MGICWWEPAHECVFRPEEHSLGARLPFKELYTINRVMLVRQMLCLLLVAKLLLLAFLLWKAVVPLSCISRLWIASLLPD